jgi:Septum formation
MVAPAGVNEGVPQDPVTAGGAGVEVAEGPTAKAEPTEAAHTQAGQADVAQAEAKPAGVIPAEVVPAPAEPVDADLAEATPAKAEPAVEDPGAGPADGEAADGEHAEAEAADGEHAEAEAADGEHAEAGADGPAWDAADESRDVNPLAVIGIIVGVIALVGMAVGVLAVITHGFRPKTVITYRPAAVFGLRAGECVNSGANALNVTVVSCTTPHDAEVFATFRLPGTGWPGASAVQQDAGNGCQRRLSGYLNPELVTADLTQEYVYPNQTAWQAGEHTAVCEIRAASGPLTGSVRAKG